MTEEKEIIVVSEETPSEPIETPDMPESRITITENSIHASDSRESFDKEVNVVF